MTKPSSISLILPTALVFIATSVGAAPANGPTIVVMAYLDKAGQLIVQESSRPDVADKSPALLAWAEGDEDRWEFIAKKKPVAMTTVRSVSHLPLPSAHFLLHAALHFALPEIPATKTLLTPINGSRLLDPHLVIRRAVSENGSRLNRSVGLLGREHRFMLRIPLPEGQGQIALADMAGLPLELRKGLPAGCYVLSLEGSDERATFTVASASERDRLLQRPDEFGALVGRSDPLYRQLTVEHLLSQRDRGKNTCPFVADALRILESAPHDAQTLYLQNLHDDLLRKLGTVISAAKTRPDRQDEDTGISGIDQVLALYAQGRWAEALEFLHRLKLESRLNGSRKRALATLCRAMILADAGLETEERADSLFQQALTALETSSAADRYRVHNEFGISLLNRVEERLVNFASHQAAGMPHPLLTALQLWCMAAKHFQAALQVAAGLGRRPLIVVQINLARQYVILADLLRMLDSRADADAALNPLAEAALQVARGVAAQVLKEKAGSQNPSLLKGIAEEIVAHVDFREGKLEACLNGVKRARAYFLKNGSLVGVESCLRLSGACRFRMARHGDKGAAQAAIRDLSMSRCIAELLAERIPSGRTGRLLAGFFDRRADVSKQLLELLLDAGNPAGALQESEAVRARSFQAVIHAHQATITHSDVDVRPMAELLRTWPRDVVALEYYLGSKEAWVFVVSDSGMVRAQVLYDTTGNPLHSADLIRRVQQFRRNIGFQNIRMKQRLASGQGFDHAWQDELNRFRKELLPDPVRRMLARSKTVVIVPHNILHYFPFASLVTQPDTAKRGPDEMVKPQFLIDEPIAICYEPSLATWDLLRRRADRPILRASALAVPNLPAARALPGARNDVQNLQAAFGPMTGRILIDRAATQSAAWSLLAEPGVVLFATHGSNVPDQPLKSCLCLYPDATNDGRLTAGQIFGKSIHSDIIVLSACDSGLADREPLPGDDLFGLQHAILRSGGRTVVSGLWDVYDRTGPELTRGLFCGLVNGKTTPQALADSQRTFLSKLRASKNPEPYLHPYFWALYTVNGDDRTACK